MCRRKSIKSRPYALTEWFESRASQIQGTRAPAVVGASPPVAARALARKASTLAAAGASPSRKSLRSGTRGGRGGTASASGTGTAGRLLGVMESIGILLPAERSGHKADYVPYNE